MSWHAPGSSTATSKTSAAWARTTAFAPTAGSAAQQSSNVAPGEDHRVAVAPADRRPHDGRARAPERLDDRPHGRRRHQRRIDEVHEHGVHAWPVRHRQPGLERRQLSLVAPRCSRRRARGSRHGASAAATASSRPHHHHHIVHPALGERAANARDERLAADGQQCFRTSHAGRGAGGEHDADDHLIRNPSRRAGADGNAGAAC